MFFIRCIYLGLLSTLSIIPGFSNRLSNGKMNTSRLLLADLRGGDYAHAGDKEAIDMVVEKVLSLSPHIQKGASLDVGSGLGGTANYMYSLDFRSIYGVDLDQAAVEHAQNHYPKIPFFTANAKDVAKLFHRDFFSFIYMFNVIYAIEDKSFLLKNLYHIAKPGAILVLFDYTTEQTSFSLKDLAGKPMYPIVLQELEKNLQVTGWETIETHDLSSHFMAWYRNLLDKMEKEQQILSLKFSEADMAKVKTTFSTIYDWLQTSQLGGTVIYAKKPD